LNESGETQRRLLLSLSQTGTIGSCLRDNLLSLVTLDCYFLTSVKDFLQIFNQVAYGMSSIGKGSGNCVCITAPPTSLSKNASAAAACAP
jgi:hypothetical protein